MKSWMNNRAKLAGEMVRNRLSEKAREYLNGGDEQLYAYTIQIEAEEEYADPIEVELCALVLDSWVFVEGLTVMEMDAYLSELQEQFERDLAKWEEEAEP